MMLPVRAFRGFAKFSRSMSAAVSCSSHNNTASKPNFPPISSPVTTNSIINSSAFWFQPGHLTTIPLKIPIIRPNIENPLINVAIEIETPEPFNRKEIIDNRSNIIDMDLPTISNKTDENGYQAAVMVGIRKRKMKKHKLKKLRKKMHFEWAKVRQRRELRKEKAFQAVLIADIKEAEKFSAEKYVQEKLNKANEIIIPKYWKHKRLPEFIIKEKMGIK